MCKRQDRPDGTFRIYPCPDREACYPDIFRRLTDEEGRQIERTVQIVMGSREDLMLRASTGDAEAIGDLLRAMATMHQVAPSAN